MTNYHYEVIEHVMTLEQNERKSFSHTETFEDRDIREAYKKAKKWYDDRLDGMEKKGDFYGLDFASPKDYSINENSAYSVTMYLVETALADGDLIEENIIVYHPVAGESDEEMAEGLEIQERLLN